MLDTVPATPRWSFAKAEADRLTAPFSAPPIPVHEIAEQSGVDVVFYDFGKFADAVSGLCDFANARILVNTRDRLERKMFTIAHELGHWVLHRDIFAKDPDRYPVLPRFSNPNAGDPLEKEANHFAANLLVPDRLLKPVMDGPVSSLTRIFVVSRTMMEFRLRNARSA